MIRLTDITEDNWFEAASLSVKDSQKGYVAPAIGILARGYVYRGCNARIFAIENDGVIVGLALVREFTDEPLGYDLQQFMIDQRYQGRGHGSAAMDLILAELRKEGHFDHVEVCVKKGDAEALRLYEKHGFIDSGYVDEDVPDAVNMICYLGPAVAIGGIMDKKAMMENLAREAYEKGGLSGAWLYAENGEIVAKGAMGYRDPENTLPVTEETIFQLASISKTFTGAAVMLAVRKGLFGLDDRIVQYFPELTAYEGVTVRHLLTHTAGVPDYFDDMDWFFKIWREEHRVPGNDEIVRFLCETEEKPLFAPGEGLEYSNTGYNVLALLVERLSGVPYEEFLQNNIFEPAGMVSTRCCHIRRDGIPFANFARATVFENGRYVADVDSEDYGEVAAFDGLNGDDYVYTNIFDMLAWDKALREGKILTPEEQQLAYTPATLNNGETAVYDEEENMGYGFGWGVEQNVKFGLIVSHSGGMPGVATWLERFIDADRVLIVLTSREVEEFRTTLGFFDGLRKIVRDEEPDPIRTIEEIAIQDPDKSKWESFCGKYEHPADDDFAIDEVFLKDGDLYAKASDEDRDEFEFRLYPIGEDTFGRKGGMLKVTFDGNCLTFDGITCKKL